MPQSLKIDNVTYILKRELPIPLAVKEKYPEYRFFECSSSFLHGKTFIANYGPYYAAGESFYDSAESLGGVMFAAHRDRFMEIIKSGKTR